ncbi:hypothetical protein JOF56_011144 [Kibdelosporangium banguiense]|uniref:Uncharacterized protein n=1 Tax=Kibdelosporangium banguiense TaxID=1365924 RepID=A0ABS4U3I0_9PSEU|nr:hypothetical protein [Kibdelosporangium banguiense]MBP2330759.1 hypothetical protein [Kibdelosporangium banguiense]
MSTEEMIKHAFEKQAGRAGDHRRVLAEVARRTSSRRRIGIGGISLLTAGVAAVVVTPFVLFTGDGGQPVTTGPAATPPQPSVAATETETVPPGTPVMKYQPSQLPDGATESQRMSQPDGTLMRIWKLPSQPAAKGESRVTLTLQKATKLPDRTNFPGDITPVDINGVPGQLVDVGGKKDEGQGGQGLVEWMAAPGERLTLAVDFVPNASEVVVQIARSIRPDGNAAIVRSAGFGWLPETMKEGLFSVWGTTPTDYSLLLDTDLAPQARGQKRVTAQIDRDKPGSATAGNGTPVTVRGKQGVFIGASGTAGSEHGEVWVELTGGLWLEVSGPVSQADLVKVADTMTINLDVKFPWIGKR